VPLPLVSRHPVWFTMARMARMLNRGGGRSAADGATSVQRNDGGVNRAPPHIVRRTVYHKLAWGLRLQGACRGGVHWSLAGPSSPRSTHAVHILDLCCGNDRRRSPSSHLPMPTSPSGWLSAKQNLESPILIAVNLSQSLLALLFIKAHFHQTINLRLCV